MKYEFLAAAWVEFQHAVEYYEERRPGLGDEFATEIQEAASKILHNPAAWPRVSKDIRRCHVKRFPYALIYQVRRDLILIVAVAHFRRDPSYWRHRVES